MKNILLILVFFTSFNLFSFQKFDGSSFYVSAESSLSIREKPSLKSEKNGKLDFKSKVKIKEVLFENFESIQDDGLKISSNWVLIENPSDPELESYVFGGFLRQKDYKKDSVIDTSNWVDFKLENHNIFLKQPKGWINITSKNNENVRWSEDVILKTHEDGMDPTQIIIRVEKKSIMEIEKGIAAKGWFRKIEEIKINEKKVLKCTYYFDNGCSNIIYLHKSNENETNIVEVSGTCDTHPKGYDETKIKVAESVKF